MYDPITNELIIESGEEINEEIANKIDQTSIDEIEIRSVLTCETKRGACANVMEEILLTEKWLMLEKLLV